MVMLAGLNPTDRLLPVTSLTASRGEAQRNLLDLSGRQSGQTECPLSGDRLSMASVSSAKK